MESHKKILDMVCKVVSLLSSENYDELEKLTSGTRLSSQELKQAILEYSEKICPLPPEALREVIIINICGSSHKSWSVTCPLSTDSKERSDLTIEMTIKENYPEDITVEIDNIHVL